MRIKKVLVSVSIALTFLVSAGDIALSAQAQGGPDLSKLPADEQALAKAIMSAPDAAAKLKAAGELIKKHPKTVIRPRVANDLADQIGGVPDAATKLSLAQEYQTIFNDPSERALIVPVLVEAFAGANRPDEAFSTGSDFVASNPESLGVLIALVSVGTDQAKKQNTKFVVSSLQFAAKAVELIGANKKPANLDEEGWSRYKTAILPGLYQSMGLFELMKGDRPAAKARFAKAAELAPNEPFNYLMLAGFANDEYQTAAKSYQAMPDGPAKPGELAKVMAALDNVIDVYAHAVALAEGNERLAGARQQYLQDLESYYKFRHNNSNVGMQQLIDKYKVVPK